MAEPLARRRRGSVPTKLRVRENLAAKDNPLRRSKFVDILAWIVLVHYCVSKAAFRKT